MGQLSQFAPFLLLIIVFFILRKYKIKRTKNIEQIKKSSNYDEIDIPETCPHCKNPNTKKVRLCEWCGNQII